MDTNDLLGLVDLKTLDILAKPQRLKEVLFKSVDESVNFNHHDLTSADSLSLCVVYILTYKI